MALSVKLVTGRGIFKSSKRLIMCASWNFNKANDDLEKNPYFEKYAEKIHKFRQTNPEEFEHKLKEVEDKKVKKSSSKIVPPNLQIEKSKFVKDKKGLKPKTLDSIMNVQLLEGKTEKEIEEIWKTYYKTKDDVIYATLRKENYFTFVEKCNQLPTFVIPLPKDDGYELFMSQYEENCIHFASLAKYHQHKENCPECLCLTYFPDLPQNIVLMLGEYDNKTLTSLEATGLVNMLQVFYNSEDKIQIVKHFNKNPDSFDYNTLITAVSNLTVK